MSIGTNVINLEMIKKNEKGTNQHSMKMQITTSILKKSQIVHRREQNKIIERRPNGTALPRPVLSS